MAQKWLTLRHYEIPTPSIGEAISPRSKVRDVDAARLAQVEQAQRAHDAAEKNEIRRCAYQSAFSVPIACSIAKDVRYLLNANDLVLVVFAPVDVRTASQAGAVYDVRRLQAVNLSSACVAVFKSRLRPARMVGCVRQTRWLRRVTSPTHAATSLPLSRSIWTTFCPIHPVFPPKTRNF